MTKPAGMKTMRILLVLCLFYTSAKAQYVLQIGKKHVPIKTGDTLSRCQLFSGFVRLLYLPDTIYPNSGIKEITLITAVTKGNASAYSFSGNTLFSLPSYTKGCDTLVKTLVIAQVKNRKGYVRPVNIRLTLTE